MSTSRIVRVNALLKREIAEDLQRVFLHSDFDCAAVTVTRVECAPDLHDANVFISIFGHENRRDGMIAYLNRHRQEIVRLMIRRVKLKYTPRLHFLLDDTIEGGDRILTILAEMERENPAVFTPGKKAMMHPNNSRRRHAREPDPYHGILLVDKPGGWTSHDVVAKIRNHFRFNKVGHGGTLDPMATGLLVLLIGNGTRLSGLIMGGDKIYEGIIRLGITTGTQDAEGEVLETRDTSAIVRSQVDAVVRSYIGDIEQIPPMVSAIKKDGVPLYKLARKGQEIEREPRKIHIASFDIFGFENPDISFRVKSSKGTYVRTLAHDIGRDLGTGGHLHALRRTGSGPLRLDQAFSLEEILACDRAGIGTKIHTLADMAT